jgi:hypothetical protein
MKDRNNFLTANQTSCWIFIFFILSILDAGAQCRRAALYAGGKFFPIQYDESYRRFLSPTGYLGYCGMCPKSIEEANQRTHIRSHKIYDSTEICSHGINTYYNGKKWSIFNDYGVKLSDFKYDFAFPYLPEKSKLEWTDGNNMYAFVRIGNKWGLIGPFGTELTAVEYELPSWNGTMKDSLFYSLSETGTQNDTAASCHHCGNGSDAITLPIAKCQIVLAKNGRLGALDTLGKMCIPFQYEHLTYYASGCKTGFREGKSWYLKDDGTEIRGFEEVYPILIGKTEFSGIYLLKLKGKWGFLNSKSNEQVKCIFEDQHEIPSFDLAGENELEGSSYIGKNRYDFIITPNHIKIIGKADEEVTKRYLEKGK